MTQCARALLRGADGSVIPLATDRFHGDATPGERAQLARSDGPVLDVGCGPGRLVLELASQGRVVLGVDTSPVALGHARERGAAVLERSIFDRLPCEGRWQTALLVDGNIGIGGDPVALLRRIAELVGATGAALVEIDPPGHPTRRLTVTLEAGHTPSPPFPWATVSLDGVERVAESAGWRVAELIEDDGRFFAWLHR